MIDSLTDMSMEMTFTVEEADLKKLQEVLCDIKIEECPWFEVHDKYGKSAKYYREKLPDKQLSNNSPKVDSDSGELISKQDAINGKISVQRTNGVEIYSDDVVPVKYLENLPSAQPEPHWIPCKDRMPDKDGDYIVSGKWEDGKISVGECDYSTEDGYFNASWRFTVLAWMEKPEPYEEVVL